jgi:hypothetical protein
MKRINYIILIMALMIQNCKKPYLPPIIAVGDSHLVVEGAINTGQDSTIIRLTHTIALATPNGTMPPPELGASVVVQSDANANYPLIETGNGYYMAVGLNLSATAKYRLQITTADKKVYQSDYIVVKNSQPIDSISFKPQSNAVQINVTTHDPSNNSRYYRWDYSETWIIHADYQSLLILQTSPKDTVVDRPFDQQIYTCWQTDQSSDIILASTSKLNNDVLVNSPISVLASNSEKFTQRYSILVKQYALTPDAYNYYQELRKNTEELGSIFSPQPSSLTGNIHCITNPSEQVIGYMTAGAPAQKRVYINKSDLPVGPQWITATPYDQCFISTFLFVNKNNQNEVYTNIYHGDAIPLTAIGQPGGPPLGYTASSGICVDCTLRGTNKQPAFWTNQ